MFSLSISGARLQGRGKINRSSLLSSGRDCTINSLSITVLSKIPSRSVASSGTSSFFIFFIQPMKHTLIQQEGTRIRVYNQSTLLINLFTLVKRLDPQGKCTFVRPQSGCIGESTYEHGRAWYRCPIPNAGGIRSWSIIRSKRPASEMVLNSTPSHCLMSYNILKLYRCLLKPTGGCSGEMKSLFLCHIILAFFGGFGGIGFESHAML